MRDDEYLDWERKAYERNRTRNERKLMKRRAAVKLTFIFVFLILAVIAWKVG